MNQRPSHPSPVVRAVVGSEQINSTGRRRRTALRRATVNVVGIGVVALAMSAGAVRGADTLWDNDGIDAPSGGPGQWDMATPRWLFDGNYEPFNPNDDAVLGGTGGAVQLQEEISLVSLRFDAPNYAITIPNGITGTTPTLNFGSTGVIDTGAHTAEIFARINGSGGYTKRGTGTLIFHGGNGFANNAAGDIVVEAGTLALGNTLIADFPNASLLDIRAGATVHLGIFGGAYADGVGGITGSGNIVLQPSPGFGVSTGSSLSIGSNGSATLPTIDTSSSFAGNISGEGGRLTKSGSGTLTLSGNNTYTGVTNVTRGTLVLQGGNALPDQSGLFVAGAAATPTTVTFEADETIGSLNGGNASTVIDIGANDLTVGGDNRTTTFTGIVRGSGRLIKVGTGTQIFGTTASEWTGGVTVKEGAFIASADSRYGAVPAAPTPGAITLDGGGIGSFVGAPYEVHANRGILVTERGGNIYLAGGTTEASGTLTYNGVIEGTGPITKSGPGNLVLGGQNTASGPWTVTDGALTSTASTGSPLGGGSITLDGAALNFRPPVLDLPADSAVAIANGAPGSTLRYGAGSKLEVNKNPLNNTLTLTIGNAAPSGPVLARNGAGTLTLRYGGDLGDPTFGERVLVNGGVPVTNGIVSPSIIGSRISNNVGDFLTYDATDGFKVATYAVNDINAATPTDVANVPSSQAMGGSRQVYALRTGDIVLDLGGTLTVGDGVGPAGVIMNGGLINGGTLAFGASDAIVYTPPAELALAEIASNITGTAGLAKVGTGELVLSGANNTLTGGVRVTDGTLTIRHAGALPAANVVTLSGNGALKTEVSGVTVAGLEGKSRSNRVDIVGDLVVRGTSRFRGVVAGNRLVKEGAGTLTLGEDLSIGASPSATNAYSGLTVRGGGVVSVSSSASLPSASPTGNDIIALDDGTLRITSITNTALNGASTFTISSGGTRRAVTVGAGGGTIDVTDPNEIVFLQNSNTVRAQLLFGSGTLTKTGAGFLRLGPGNDGDAAVAGDGFTGKFRVMGGNLQFQEGSSLGEAPATLVPDQFQIGDGGMIQSNGFGQIEATRGTTLLGGEAFFNTASGSFTFNGPITGPGGITKVGSTTTTAINLAAANDFQGDLKLLNGRVNLNASNAAGQGNIVLKPEYPVTLGKSAGETDSVIPNAISAMAGSSIALQVDGATTGRLVLNGNVSGDAKRIFKTGIGNVVLGGNASTFGGDLVVQQGTLTVTGANALGAAGAGGNTVVNPGSTLTFAGNHTGAETVYIAGNGVSDGGAVQSLGGSPVAFAGSVVATQSAKIGTNDSPLTIAGGMRVGRGSTLVKVGPAALDTGPVAVGPNATLSLQEGRTRMKNVRGNRLDLAGGDAAIAPDGTDAGTSVLSSLQMLGSNGAWQSELDLDNNDLIHRANAATRDQVQATVEDMVKTARDTGTGGRWTGKGLTSSAARGNSNTGLVVVPNFGLTQFSGQLVGPDDVLVKYSWNGDANVDGVINSDDYFRIDSGFLAQPANPRYRDGDFNDDQQVNSDDYFLIDSAFLGQTGTLDGGGAVAGALQSVAVPEPGVALACIGFGALALRRRRRV